MIFRFLLTLFSLAVCDDGRVWGYVGSGVDKGGSGRHCPQWPDTVFTRESYSYSIARISYGNSVRPSVRHDPEPIQAQMTK